MINIKEIIMGYKDQGYSGYDALIMAKAELREKTDSLREVNKVAELRRVNRCVPSNKKYSVVYGSKKGVM